MYDSETDLRSLPFEGWLEIQGEQESTQQVKTVGYFKVQAGHELPTSFTAHGYY